MQNKKKGEAGIGTAGRHSRRIVKLKDLRLEMISNFDIYNPRADKNGYVKEWVARNEWGNAVALVIQKRSVWKMPDVIYA